MGIFGGIGKALKNIDWSKVSAGMQSAGAISHGDYGTAAQIQNVYAHERHQQHEDDLKQQQAQAAIAALVRNGVPEADARALVASGAADTVLANRYQQQQPNEFERTLRAAGIDPASPQGQGLYRQRAATMASPAPQMVGTPATGYQFITPPAPQLPQAGGPQPGAVVNGYRFKGGDPNDRNSWEPVAGGAGSNAGGGFHNYPRY